MRSIHRNHLVACVILAASVTVACGQADAAVGPGDGPSTSLSSPPPPMLRGVQALLQSWEAAWNAGDAVAFASHYHPDADVVGPTGGVLPGRAGVLQQHAFLFGGPFAGSSQSHEVRRIVALTGSIAIVDVNVALTGYAARPPGLSETEPGLVATRMRLVVERNGSGWWIVAQQITVILPMAPPPV